MAHCSGLASLAPAVGRGGMGWRWGGGSEEGGGIFVSTMERSCQAMTSKTAVNN